MLKEKSEIVVHHQNVITFIHSLKSVDENRLRKPIGEGKWSIIEIVGHFYPWDEFVLQQRIPYIFSGEHLPEAPGIAELNDQSSLQARTEAVENTLEKCIHVRQDLLSLLKQIPEDDWLIPIQINQSTLTFYEYLKGLMEHDIHHLNQMKSTI
ncbi:DinB family protein [Solibacillus sp. FSL R5-0691]|uniref:DinB family protein n=1 Tax=unclassified Solibacillus TaxID=2637870 RepID=UPI0030CD15A5